MNTRKWERMLLNNNATAKKYKFVDPLVSYTADGACKPYNIVEHTRWFIDCTFIENFEYIKNIFLYTYHQQTPPTTTMAHFGLILL